MTRPADAGGSERGPGPLARLLDALEGRRTFVISSGCDIPPDAPLANLDAFFEACREHAAGRPVRA